jgi:hypothetical protein
MKSEYMTADAESRLPTQMEDVLRNWNLLSEDDKLRLLPHLLSSIEDWPSATRDERFLIGWLRRKFANAGLTLRTSVTG